MIRHVVVWRFQEEAQGASRAENLRAAKAKIEALAGEVPGFLSLSAGINAADSPDASDLVLVADFESWDALRAYQDHPAHRRLVEFLRSVRTERRVIDWEV
jgi:antibiotic biosynthesis monooxygenase (ABM) superfamily enzyme